MKIVVDSNVFVSIYFATEKYHEKAKKFYEKILSKEIEPVSSVLMLPEICGGISRRIGKEKARKVRVEIESLIRKGMLKLEEISSERMNSASTLAIGFQIKGADSVFVSLAKELNVHFLTFDYKLKKRIKSRVKLFEV